MLTIDAKIIAGIPQSRDNKLKKAQMIVTVTAKVM